MTRITEILAPERVAWNVQANSKKRALEILSELLARDRQGPDAGSIFASLVQREKLGSTGMGKGIALPHGRIAGLEQTRGAVIRLARPVEYDSGDRRQVDLLFALLVPEQCNEAHLETLAMLAGMFRDDRLPTDLRSTDSATDAYRLLIHAPEPRRATA